MQSREDRAASAPGHNSTNASAACGGQATGWAIRPSPSVLASAAIKKFLTRHPPGDWVSRRTPQIRHLSMSPRQALCGVLEKRHLRSPGWSKRWVECDDELGIILVFKTQNDHERRTPSHFHLCSDVQVEQCTSPHFVLTTKNFTAVRKTVFFCGSEARAAEWVSGLQRRACAKQSFSIDMLLPERRERLGVTLTNWPNHAIGVIITELNFTSAFALAGCSVGDALLAVGTRMCHSHTHALHLLKESSNPVYLLLHRHHGEIEP